MSHDVKPEPDLLGELFEQSQQSEIAKDVTASRVYATAAAELVDALANIRKALLGAAKEAGLANVTFTPEPDETADHIEPRNDENGHELPTIEFALTARNAGSQLSLVIRGMAVRTFPSNFNAAFYTYSSLTISLFNSGIERTTMWQPIAMDVLEQRDGDAVPRVDNGYFVSGQRLAMVIRELMSSQRPTHADRW